MKRRRKPKYIPLIPRFSHFFRADRPEYTGRTFAFYADSSYICKRIDNYGNLVNLQIMANDRIKHDLGGAWQIVKGYFNIMADKEDEQATVESISSGVSFRGATLWVLIFAIFIASLGLNVNSTAVIIGAMLISPLMGPIIGMGLAIGINDLDLLKRSLKNYAVATVISVITSTVYFLLSPFDEVQSELLARTAPTLYDVLIAFCGGAAGIIAIATKGKGNVIPGVAIATALMPPLCTAGYGIATGNFFYFLGAFYLFFINTVFICLATFLGVRRMRFSHKQFVNYDRYRKVQRYIVGLVIITMLPAGYMTVNILHGSLLKANLRKFVDAEFAIKGTSIIDKELDNSKKTIRLVAVGKEISKAVIENAQGRLEQYRLGGYTLRVIQGTQSDSLLVLNNKLTDMKTDNIQTMQMQYRRISELEKQLGAYTRYGKLSREMTGELKALYPKVQTLSLSPATQVSTDTAAVRSYVIALMGIRRGERLSENERPVLEKWLKARVKTDSLRLVTVAAE